MKKIDYCSVAELYDAYVSADFDFDFFKQELAQTSGPVLELMSGTGRLSLPLIEAGAEMTCVDGSAQMLSVLSRKLTDLNLNAEVLCQDVCELSVPRLFDLAILPFQSFMEIVGEERQRDTLAAVFAVLNPNGQFICTMHNPAVRRSSVDGTLRIVGDFPLGDGTLVVSGFERGGDPVVTRLQFFEYYSADSALEWKRILPMQFEFIDTGSFQRMAEGAGFTVDDLVGDYRGAPFDADLSPVMIWRLRKPAEQLRL